MKITKDDIREFRETENGKIKYLWLKIGIIIDLLLTLSVCILQIYSYIFNSSFVYYLILYILLVIIVVGGELIGTYFGALEQFVINKKICKKRIDYMESEGNL